MRPPQHSLTDSVCSGCEFKLQNTHPLLGQWFRTLIKPRFQDAHISCSDRNQADQMKAFNGGFSKLPWPRSKHNHLDEKGLPCSLALDLFQLTPSGAKFPYQWYLDIIKEVEARGDAIRCGGRFAKFKDYPHFELIQVPLPMPDTQIPLRA